MNAYVYAAALHCGACIARHVLGVPLSNLARAIERERTRHGIPEGASDTDNVPDGPHGDGGGESDSPAHCDTCGTFLGNPLTSDGMRYVRDAIDEFNATGKGAREVLELWRAFYCDSVTRFGATDLPMIQGPNATAAGPFTVTRTGSRVFAFDYPAQEFETMAAALSHAKGIAHAIRDKAPGTGGSLFPMVRDVNGYAIPYEIRSY